MLVKGLNSFIGFKSRWVLKETKVVKAVFMFFEAELFDFAVFLKQSSYFIFNLFLTVLSIQVGKEELVAVRILSFWLFLLSGRWTALYFNLSFD